jgi:hypothetical protein
MATNLRLRPEAEEAVRIEAERTGCSQQEVIRTAIDRHLGLSPNPDAPRGIDPLVATGVARAPRAPYRKATKRIALGVGVNSADLLDRSDRL